MVLVVRVSIALVAALLTGCGASDGQSAAVAPAGHLGPPHARSRMFKETTYLELAPLAPPDRLVAIVRCEAVETLSPGTRSQRQVFRTSVLTASARAEGSTVNLAAFSQAPPLMNVGGAYLIAAYRESAGGPWALVEALPTSAVTAAGDWDAAQAEMIRELGDDGGAPLRQVDLTDLHPRPLAAAPVTAVSPDVRFTVDATVAVERKGATGSPEPQRPVLVVTGRLRNTATTERTVHLFPVGRSGMGGAADTPFVVTLSASDAVVDASPALPPEPPQTLEVTLPPRSEVPFRTYVDTLHLRYQGAPHGRLEWTFHFSSSTPSPRGTLAIQLPARP